MQLGKYTGILWKTTSVTSQISLTSRFGAGIFLLAKLLRISFFLLFLIILESKTKAIAGYTLWQVILFFLTFNIIDSLSQFLLREVYRFRQYVLSGHFDYILTKPFPPLIRSLLGGVDILDLPILLMLIAALIFVILHIGSVSTLGVLLYIALVINAFFIALAFHIVVLAIGILTTEVDNAIMLYRDFTQMGRVPVDLYQEPIRGLITFIIPVGIMMTFPGKALFGLLSWQIILIAFLISGAAFFLSLRLWKYALSRYASASS